VATNDKAMQMYYFLTDSQDKVLSIRDIYNTFG